MKLKNTFYLLLGTMAFAVAACNQNSNSKTAQMSAEDSAKIAFYDRYFSQSGLLPDEKNKPVDPKIAKRCVDLYLTKKAKMNVDTLKKMLKTESVSFQMAELTPWLQDTLKGVKFDNMRICFGVYDMDAVRLGSKADSLAGRLTVYLWPYLGNEKALDPNNISGSKDPNLIKPFNLGNLKP